MYPRWILACILLALTVLAGCGQKGPLYLPSDREAAEQYDPTGETFETEQDNDTGAGDETSPANAKE